MPEVVIKLPKCLREVAAKRTQDTLPVRSRNPPKGDKVQALHLVKNMPSPKQIKGARGEALAAAMLEEKGYVILERNFRFMKAEVDLIAFLPTPDYTRGGDLVFIEVKWRRDSDFAVPESAVNALKKRLMIQAAEAFLHERKLEGTPCRFDVVAITGEGPKVEIEHIESAFIA